MSIEFFGEVDKNAKGQNTSDLPSWFFNIHMEDLQEQVSRSERQIVSGQVNIEAVPMLKQEIVNKKKRISEIKKSIPKLTGSNKTQVGKQYNELKNKIADSMPTIRDNEKGFVDPREELKRLKEHHIEVSPELAESCSVKHVKGKVTGDGANRMYKMMGRLLGENENVEKIRKEGRSESQRSMDALTEFALSKMETPRG